MSTDFLNLKSQENLSILIVNQKLLLDILNILEEIRDKLPEPKPPKPPKKPKP